MNEDIGYVLAVMASEVRKINDSDLTDALRTEVDLTLSSLMKSMSRYGFMMVQEAADDIN